MGERNLSTRRTLALALASASYVAYDQATGQFANASPALSGADLDAHLARAERFVAAGPGAVARTVQSKLREYPSVTDFADPLSFDGVTDNAAAFRAAAATGQPYFVPPGLAYRLRNSVAHAFPGQYAFGSGCTATKIAIHPDFDMSALGVFTSPPSAEGAGLRDLELAFIQTDTRNRADVIAYPPAYYLNNTTRARFHGVRLSAGERGLVFAGNCGGAVVEDLQSSCLSSSVEIDGCQDTMRFDRVHIYPFGLSPGLISLFNTASFGIQSGRCDGLHITNALFLVGTALHLFTGRDGNNTFGLMTTGGLDTYGGILMEDGQFSISSAYGSLGARSNLSIYQTGGDLTAAGVWFYTAVSPDRAQIYTNGGSFSAIGCHFNTGNFDARAVWIDSGTAQATLTGNRFSRVGTKVYSAPSVSIDGSRGTVVGNSFQPVSGGGAGIAMHFGQDTAWQVAANDLGGQSLRKPETYAKLNFEGQEGVLLPAFADDQAAASGGLAVGRRYRNGNIVRQRIS